MGILYFDYWGIFTLDAITRIIDRIFNFWGIWELRGIAKHR